MDVYCHSRPESAGSRRYRPAEGWNRSLAPHPKECSSGNNSPSPVTCPAHPNVLSEMDRGAKRKTIPGLSYIKGTVLSDHAPLDDFLQAFSRFGNGHFFGSLLFFAQIGPGGRFGPFPDSPCRLHLPCAPVPSQFLYGRPRLRLAPPRRRMDPVASLRSPYRPFFHLWSGQALVRLQLAVRHFLCPAPPLFWTGRLRRPGDPAACLHPAFDLSSCACFGSRLLDFGGHYGARGVFALFGLCSTSGHVHDHFFDPRNSVSLLRPLERTVFKAFLAPSDFLVLGKHSHSIHSWPCCFGSVRCRTASECIVARQTATIGTAMEIGMDSSSLDPGDVVDTLWLASLLDRFSVRRPETDIQIHFRNARDEFSRPV